jgi:hypothetical protein
VNQLDSAKERVQETEQFFEDFAGSHGVTMGLHNTFIAPRASVEHGNYHYFSPKVYGQN